MKTLEFSNKASSAPTNVSSVSKSTPKSLDRLKPGDRVTLRAPNEILATLDGSGALEGLPFMPEMLQHYGKAFTVAKRAEKICDTICPVGSRRLPDCVYLENLRCDGATHSGCQAECRIYWKDAWLVRLGPGEEPARPDEISLGALRALIQPHVHKQEQPELFRCQATEARRATTKLPDWDLRQYAREVTNGNITRGQLLRVSFRAMPRELDRLARAVLPIKLRSFVRKSQDAARALFNSTHQYPPLDLQPGEWVEVRSATEIKKTLNSRSRNRGLSFSAPEMLPACGKKFQVRRRITRIIDEVTGRMLQMKHDCIVLEGFVCTGERSVGRWFCGREIYPYWREAWLKRVVAPHLTRHPSSACAQSAEKVAAQVRTGFPEDISMLGDHQVSTQPRAAEH